ncbi:MAG: AGE family epimerase/isomerase [Lentisphaerae bacterium]|nr:AGE family epimerase/isomerase [Lentisphaerota bacterium]
MTTPLPTAQLDDWLETYRRTLLDDVVPFWLRHGIDRAHGGLCNVMDDAGRVTSHDKYLWSQGRALWTFSALANRIERRPEWLEAAHHLFRYLEQHGRDERGYWMYRLDAEGNVLERDTSLYVDGFVMTGLAEYARATGNAAALRLALDTYDRVADRLRRPGSYGTAPHPIPPGLKPHGIDMIFSFFFDHLGRTADRADIREHGLTLVHSILRDFYRPEKDAILEFVTPDGRFADTPEGRTCVPGHGLEALWFILSILGESGDRETIRTCVRLIRRHLDLAWDDVHGGLRLALDIDGKEPLFWKKADSKPWWVQVEALVATALAWRRSGDAGFLEWHDRIRTYAYAHYPVPTGEWTQWLDREGRKMESAALPVKDPFHLPRALMTLIGIFSGKSRK